MSGNFAANQERNQAETTAEKRSKEKGNMVETSPLNGRFNGESKLSKAKGKADRVGVGSVIAVSLTLALGSFAPANDALAAKEQETQRAKEQTDDALGDQTPWRLSGREGHRATDPFVGASMRQMFASFFPAPRLYG